MSEDDSEYDNDNYDDEYENKPVFSFLTEPKVLSENLVQFISRTNLGPLYGSGGKILFNKIQDILPFLNETIDGDNNVFYRISDRKIIRTLFRIYLLLRKSESDQPTTRMNYYEYEMLRHYFPSININIRVTYGFHYIIDIIEKNISDQYDNIDNEVFLEENATPEQLIQVHEYYNKIEGFNNIYTALEVVGLPKTDDLEIITKLYEINPILYSLAMNEQIFSYLDRSYRVLSDMELETRSVSMIKSAKHR